MTLNVRSGSRGKVAHARAMAQRGAFLTSAPIISACGGQVCNAPTAAERWLGMPSASTVRVEIYPCVGRANEQIEDPKRHTPGQDRTGDLQRVKLTS